MSDINSIFQNVISNSKILDVVEHYLGAGSIQKQGKNYKCLCPFHDDKHPSMSLDVRRNIFNCFSCNEKGGVLEFVMKYRKLSKMEALKELASISNIPLPKDLTSSSIPSIKSKFPDEINALNDLSKFYQLMLASNLGSDARDYLKKRKLDEEIIKHFEIGFAPIDNKKSIEALEKTYSIPTLEKAGILSSSNKNEDRLFNRITFPLKDSNGIIVGFSGRAIANDDSAKYINYSDTEIFKKGDILFNYFDAKNHTKNSQCVYVVEGYMDAIAYYRANIKSIVATMGTALTDKQIRLIKNLDVEVRLSFDTDTPGQTNQIKVMNQLMSNNIKVKCVRPFPKFKDADEVFSSGGEKLLKELSQKLIDPFLFYLAFTLHGRKKLDDPSEINKFVTNSKYYYLKLDEVSKLKNLEILSKLTSLTSEELIKIYTTERKTERKVETTYSNENSYIIRTFNNDDKNNNQIINRLNKIYDPNILDKNRLILKSFAETNEFNDFKTSQNIFNFEVEAIINCFYSKIAVGLLNKEKYIFSFSPFNELFYLIRIVYQNNSSSNSITSLLFDQILTIFNSTNDDNTEEFDGIEVSDLSSNRKMNEQDYDYLKKNLEYFAAFIDVGEENFNESNFSKSLSKFCNLKKKKIYAKS